MADDAAERLIVGQYRPKPRRAAVRVKPRRARRVFRLPRRAWYVPTGLLVLVVAFGCGFWAIPVWEQQVGNLGWAYALAFVAPAAPVCAGVSILIIRWVEEEL